MLSSSVTNVLGATVVSQAWANGAYGFQLGCWVLGIPQAKQIPGLVEAASKTYLISNASCPKSIISQGNVDLACCTSSTAAFWSFFWADCCSWLASGRLSLGTQIIVVVHYCTWSLCYWRRSDVTLARRQGPNSRRIFVLMRGETPGRCLITADWVILMVKFFILCVNSDMLCCAKCTDRVTLLLARILSLLTLLCLWYFSPSYSLWHIWYYMASFPRQVPGLVKFLEGHKQISSLFPFTLSKGKLLRQDLSGM